MTGVVQAKVAIGAIGLTLDAAPSAGRMLVAIGFGYAISPGVAAGWTEITDARHDPVVLDPGIRAAYRPAVLGEAAAQTPFTGNPAANGLSCAVWEVDGVDTSWTPSYQLTTKNWTTFGGNSVTLSGAAAQPQTLCLFAGFQQSNSGDPGAATLTDTGWTHDDAGHGVAASQGMAIAASHDLFNVGDAISEQFSTGASGGAAAAMISLTLFSAAATVRAGVSMESSAASATFAAAVGTVDANYPVANLSDLTISSKVARITPAAGAITVTAVLADDSKVQFAGLVNHSLPAAATVKVTFYADAAMTSPVGGGQLAARTIPTPVSGYRQTFPALMAAEQTVRAVKIEIAGAGSSAVDLGALEISRFWAWPGISPGAEVGLKPTAQAFDYVGGGSSGEDNPMVRTYSGQIDKIAMTIAATRGLDLQGFKGTAAPLVFVEDYSDSASWARRCFLARNSDLPAMVGAVYRHDTFQFRLVEWLR